MQSFDYHRPESLEETLGLLGELGDDALPVAGATDVWVGIHAGKFAPRALISLRGVSALGGLAPGEDGGLALGATTPHGVVEDSAWVAEHFPALHRACSSVGSRQVRNVGTVGGNLCNAAPSADSAVPLLLYDAVCEIAGPAGRREVALESFFTGPGKTVLEHGELLVGVRLPAPPPRTWADYWKLTRRKGMELPILGVGARVSLAEDGRTVRTARIALGVAGPTPARARRAEAALEGKPLTAEAVRGAAEVASDDARVRDSWRGKAWYRREMVRVLVPRVLERAGAPVEGSG